MRENAPKDQLPIQDYLSDNCFGDYYTRTGLDVKTRELLTYSILISMGGTDGQVRGHIQGNLNVGNDRETLICINNKKWKISVFICLLPSIFVRAKSKI